MKIKILLYKSLIEEKRIETEKDNLFFILMINEVKKIINYLVDRESFGHLCLLCDITYTHTDTLIHWITATREKKI